MAFFLALVGSWNPNGLGSWPLTIFAPASALTNVVMAAVLVALFYKFHLGRRWAWSLIIAGIMNLWWIALSDLRGTFGGGFYLWLLSFFLVGFGLSLTRPQAQ
jgi:hypothetical protein